MVEALPDAPAHRRAPLCAALLRACPPGEGLPQVLLLLLGQIGGLEEAARASEAKRVKRAAKAAKEVGGRVAAALAAAEEEENAAVNVAASGAWVLQLAALLLAHETASGAVDALVATMKVRGCGGFSLSFLGRGCGGGGVRGFFFSRFFFVPYEGKKKLGRDTSEPPPRPKPRPVPHVQTHTHIHAPTPSSPPHLLADD